MSSVTSPTSADQIHSPTVIIEPARMTVEQLLAMPEDNLDRDLIRGQLKETEMTGRNRFHAATEAAVAYVLSDWNRHQSPSPGRVYSGEVGCILRRDPDTHVGIDVAFFSSEVIAIQNDDSSMIEGAPLLAVEILSPHDVLERVNEKIDEYLAAGVKMVWIIDPHFQTITVYEPQKQPILYNRDHTLTAGDCLPHLSVPVSSLFA